jgi:CTP synthase (UTP-ammonia lyase)
VIRSRPDEDDVTSGRPRIAVVGDFDLANRTHRFTNAALEHVGLDFTWVATDVSGDWDERLAAYDGVWIAPASPYRSMDGALAAVRYARERGVPLVGT